MRRVLDRRSRRRTSPRTSVTSSAPEASGPLPATTTGISSLRAACINYRSSSARVGGPKRCSAAGAPTSSSSRSRGPRLPSIWVWIRPISALAPLSDPTSSGIRIYREAQGHRIDGSTPPRLRCRRRSPSEALRVTASSGLVLRMWMSRWPRAGPCAGRLSWSSGGRCSIFSTGRTSICPIGYSARRTSVESSARQRPARCNLGCGSRSDRPTGVGGQQLIFFPCYSVNLSGMYAARGDTPSICTE